MLIPEQKIAEVLERVDIVAVVSRHVELKKAGRSYKGRCPFHQEKTASFHVTPDMGRFKCFGCQAGGDAIAFIQRYLGKTFVDAVRDLAREVGVDLEAAQDPSARERRELKEVTDVAFQHFRTRLLDEKEGARARAYLDERAVTEEARERFGLGYALPSWSDLADRLTEEGILEWGLKAGLVAARQRGGGYYDVFRGRLIIPIRSPEGRNIGFGGRKVEGEEGPKYLNSRESALYNKSETLFGMDLAREEIRRRKVAILVEGYFDCIALHEVGLKNAVALCSTALTPGHLEVLARAEARELVLLLDGDLAGRKAVERLSAALLSAGKPTRVALLPDGEDPDTFGRQEGAAGLEALVGRSRPLTEHLFAELLPKGPHSSFEEKMRALEGCRPIASQLAVGLPRSAFLGAMAAHWGLPAPEIEAAFRGKATPVRPAPKTRLEPSDRKPERPPDPLEALFVALVVKNPRLAQQDAFRVGDELTHLSLRAALALASAGRSEEEVLFESPPQVRKALEEASRQIPQPEEAVEPTFSSVCQKLKIRRIDEQLSAIARLAKQQTGANQLDEAIRRLQAERIELLALKKRVLGEGSSLGPGRKPHPQQV